MLHCLKNHVSLIAHMEMKINSPCRRTRRREVSSEGTLPAPGLLPVVPGLERIRYGGQDRARRRRVPAGVGDGLKHRRQVGVAPVRHGGAVARSQMNVGSPPSPLVRADALGSGVGTPADPPVLSCSRVTPANGSYGAPAFFPTYSVPSVWNTKSRASRSPRSSPSPGSTSDHPNPCGIACMLNHPAVSIRSKLKLTEQCSATHVSGG